MTSQRSDALVMLNTTLLNRYHLEAELGQGGMGTVYRAHDTLLDRAVAIKVLNNSQLGTQGRNRLLKEARAAAQLNHPNIVSIYDAGELESAEDGPLSYLILELVEGPSLYEAWPLAPEQLLSVARQICSALEHAHAHGILHRDLKLENVLLTRPHSDAEAAPPFVKLTDFGLARSLASRVTQDGGLIGTVFYLAPEIALGQPADGRADLYSLGVMLYELTTGQLPFSADDPLAVITQHLNTPVTPPRTLKPEIDPRLDALICQLLAKTPAERPPNAASVRAALEALEQPAESAEAAPASALTHLIRGRLVGRAAEAGELRAQWKRAAAGAGHVLLVTGEPGIGKTRLVRELLDLAEAGGGRALKSECYAEGGAPYAPIAQVLRAVLVEAPAPTVNVPPHVLADLLTLAPELRAHFSEAQAPASFAAPAEQNRLFESFVSLMAALTEQAPVLLVVDDVHWADSGTLTLLRHLARRTRRHALLIVLTYRETDMEQACCLPEVLTDLNRERLSTRLKLGRLGLEQTRELLAAMLAGEAADALTAAVHRETEGNPFFIEEVCKSLIEAGQLVFEQGRWQAAHLDQIIIPQSVRMTLQARLSKLPEASQEVLRLAAVLGREFDFDTLRQASGQAEDDVIAALESAERAQLIEEARRADKIGYSFVHALIPAALRDGTSRLRRQRLHRRAGQAIAALRPDDYEALAYHAEQAGDEPEARDYYLQAADRALAVFANQEAERYYRLVLETLSEAHEDQAERRARALTGLGEALFRLGRYLQAIQTWETALPWYQRSGAVSQAARLYARMGRAAWGADDKPRGLAICRAGLALFTEAPENDGLAYLIHETGRACYFNDLYEEAQTLCECALSIGRRRALVEVQAEALATLGILPQLPPETRVQLLTEAVALAEAGNLPSTGIRSHINLNNAIREASGDLRLAAQHLRQARELARRIGHAAEELKCLIGGASVQLNMAQWEAYAGLAREARELLPQIPQSESAQMTLTMLEAARQFQGGEVEAALRLCAEALAQTPSATPADLIDEVESLRATIHLARGDLDAAEASLQAALRAVGQGERCVQSYSLLAIVQAQQGDVSAAQAALEAAQTHAGAARHHGLLLPYFITQAEAYVSGAQGRWDEALPKAQAAQALVARSGMRWYEAFALLHWGRFVLRRGTPADWPAAQAGLGRARRIFAEMNLQMYVAQTEAAMAASPVD